MKKEKTTKGNYLFRLIKYFPRKHLLILGMLFTVLGSLATIVFSILLKMLIDAATNMDKDYFYIILGLMGGLLLFDLTVIFLRTRILGIYTEGGVSKLRNLLSEKILRIKPEKLSKAHTGDYLSRSTNDIAKIRTFTSQTFPELINIPLTGIGALTILFILSWELTLVSLVVLPILIIGSTLINKPIGGISKKLQSKLGEVNTTVTDFIKGIEVSKAYNIETILEGKHRALINESVDCGKKLEKRRAVLDSFAQILSMVPFIITFALGGYYVIEEQMTLGSLLIFINLLNHVTYPLNKMPSLIAQTISDMASSARIIDVLDQEEERTDGTSFELESMNPIIEFRKVCFSYPGTENSVFKDLSFKINHLESVAFVGPSGAGKSTITKLILGYYENYKGEIYIGGHELRSWNLQGLREKLSYVSQDTFLFPESLRENIQYGQSSTSDEEIVKSAKLANAHQFIQSFDAGYETQVGELGNTLSGGQKQRLSIARAVLKHAPIFLLDEATSALDNESEALVQEALENTFVDKTSVIIAHRLSTIKHVDKIFVLQDGEIIEEGTHQTLLQEGGAYSNLYKKQLTTKEESKEEADLNG